MQMFIYQFMRSFLPLKYFEEGPRDVEVPFYVFFNVFRQYQESYEAYYSRRKDMQALIVQKITETLSVLWANDGQAGAFNLPIPACNILVLRENLAAILDNPRGFARMDDRVYPAFNKGQMDIDLKENASQKWEKRFRGVIEQYQLKLKEIEIIKKVNSASAGAKELKAKYEEISGRAKKQVEVIELITDFLTQVNED